MEKYKPNELKDIAKFLDERNFSAHFIIPKDIRELSASNAQNIRSSNLNGKRLIEIPVEGVISEINPTEWEY